MTLNQENITWVMQLFSCQPLYNLVKKVALLLCPSSVRLICWTMAVFLMMFFLVKAHFLG